MRETGHDSLEALAVAVRHDRSGKLGDRIGDELLNQESSFFRDSTVFEVVAEAVRAVPDTRRARIWSAGCSPGQETQSLAMMFAEALDDQMPEIVATDVSETALPR